MCSSDLLTIQRPGADETTEVTITRDEIPLETVYSEMLDNGIAKIQITSFSDDTYTELTKALDEMQAEGMKGLIIDVRQNPGGLLDQAIKISSLFVPEGDVLLQVEDNEGNKEKIVAEGGQKVDVPVTVLIDKGSASASEILAAAVSESAEIPLIGVNSFGKGTVQTSESFTDGSNMKFTTAKWLTPDGTWIHEKGIKPDYDVSLPAYAELPYINPDKELKESDLSDQVKAAEEMLKAGGYDPGKADGFYDEQTTEAVRAFQEEEGLEVTGNLNSESILKLMENMRTLIETNDTQVNKAVEVLTDEMQ